MIFHQNYWMNDKQDRARIDATFCMVWSGSAAFAQPSDNCPNIQSNYHYTYYAKKKNFSRWHFEIFFLFPRENDLTIYVNHLFIGDK